MWHEARKQERRIRGMMVDYKKRAERRRDFYEKTRLDPTQFVRVCARPLRIHLEQSVALAAESPQSMMPWQGDSNITIDRFDVRAHLDYLPDTKYKPIPLTKGEEEEERLCNYERYRILVHNECTGLSEEQHLHEIYIDEQFGPPAAEVEKQKEEKKKLEGTKAAIGYTYDDSPIGGQKKRQQQEEEEKEEEEEPESSDDEIDLDLAFDVDDLNDEQIQMLNSCSEQFEIYTRTKKKLMH